ESAKERALLIIGIGRTRPRTARRWRLGFGRLGSLGARPRRASGGRLGGPRGGIGRRVGIVGRGLERDIPARPAEIVRAPVGSGDRLAPGEHARGGPVHRPLGAPLVTTRVGVVPTPGAARAAPISSSGAARTAVSGSTGPAEGRAAGPP